MSNVMDKTKLSEAVAALLPENKLSQYGLKPVKRIFHIVNGNPQSNAFRVLAFECHKALLRCYGDCQIGKGITALASKHPWYVYGKSNPIKGAGTTDEEAIFSAVLDWHYTQPTNDKRVFEEGQAVSRDIGEIGNHYGCLSVKEEDGEFFWSIEDWSGEDYQPIPESLYRELMKHQDELEAKQ